MLAGAVLLIAALSLVLWNWHESNHGGESAKKIRDTLHSALEEEEQNGMVSRLPQQLFLFQKDKQQHKWQEGLVLVRIPKQE